MLSTLYRKRTASDAHLRPRELSALKEGRTYHWSHGSLQDIVDIAYRGEQAVVAAAIAPTHSSSTPGVVQLILEYACWGPNDKTHLEVRTQETDAVITYTIASWTPLKEILADYTGLSRLELRDYYLGSHCHTLEGDALAWEDRLGDHPELQRLGSCTVLRTRPDGTPEPWTYTTPGPSELWVLRTEQAAPNCRMPCTRPYALLFLLLNFAFSFPFLFLSTHGPFFVLSNILSAYFLCTAWEDIGGRGDYDGVWSNIGDSLDEPLCVDDGKE